MSNSLRDLAVELVTNPPPGSKLAEAKEYGVDLTLLLDNLFKSPTERIRELDRAQRFLDELRSAFK
ncbi:MAG TPA: hypothetical protein VGQ11_10500 [Candidatus Acidoferrales bacterium]|jgi:hypothetical protein|nr:hypothetical protein [Candidatus Acidoferrales bacterium]